MPDPNSYASIGWVVVSLGALMLIVERGVALFKHFGSSPPAGELAITNAQLAERLAQLEEQRELDLRTGSERRQKIYAELKSQREDFQRETKAIYERIERTEKTFHEAIRHLPNEIIATLRNTGVIK